MADKNDKARWLPRDDEYEGNQYRTATLAFMRPSEKTEGAFTGTAPVSFDETEHKFSVTGGFPIGLVPIDEDGEQYKVFFGPKKVATLVRTVAKTGTVMLQGITTEAVDARVEEEGKPLKGAEVPANVRLVAYKARKLNSKGEPSPFYKSGGKWQLVAEWGHSEGAPGADNLAQFGLAGEDLPY